MQVTKNLVHWTLKSKRVYTNSSYKRAICSSYLLWLHPCMSRILWALFTENETSPSHWLSIQECSGSWTLQTKSPCPLMSQQEATIHRSPVRRFALASWMRARNTVASDQGKPKRLHLNPHHQNWRDLQWTSTARLYRLYLLVIRPYMHEHQHALNNPKKRGSAAERSS